MNAVRRTMTGRRRTALEAALLAGLLLWALAAAAPNTGHAREGIYAGLGYSGQTVTSGLDGSGTVDNLASPTHQIRLGRPDAGGGLALNGGFGFNEYLAADLLMTVSRHATVYDPGGSAEPYDATLNTVLLSVRGGMPLGDVGEVFGRAGLGGYELIYTGANIRLSDGQPVDDARFGARGYAFGIGGELYFQQWAVQLSYTVHKATFDAVDSANFTGPVNPSAGVDLSTVSILFVFYLQ